MTIRNRCGVLAAALMLLAASPAAAATLISTASGNIDATGTWSVVDTTGTNAYLNSETANTALTTSAVASSTFTPASATLTAIGVKLASVAAAPSGTLTVKLANSTSPGSRECTLTVNVSDLPATNSAPTAATADGGWIILACSASPNGTDAYTITANTSVAAQVNLFSLATTNWSRLLVTSGTQASGPAAGDKFIVAGKLTAAGARTSYSVTVQTTSGIAYGNVANTSVDPSISVCQGGTLAFATAAATNYVAQFAGPMVVYNGGVFTVGTAGSPIPSGSTATLTMNSSVEGDTGISVRNGGTFASNGASGGRSTVKTVLAATANAAATTLTTAASTGWLNGDSIAIAGTIATGGLNTGSKHDAATLSGNASGAGLTLSSGLANAHSFNAMGGSSTHTGVTYGFNMTPAVVLLNRNVVLQGSGVNTNGFLYFQANAIGAIDWTEFAKMSGTVAGKRGLEVDIGPGSFFATNSSFHDSHNTAVILGASNTRFGGTSGNYLNFQHNVIYNVATATGATIQGFANLAATFNPFWRVDDLTVIYAGNNYCCTASGVLMNSQNGQFTNIDISGSGYGGQSVGALTVTTNYSIISSIGGQVGNAWGPIYLYANVGGSLSFIGGYPLTGTINGLYMWHEAGRFIPPPNAADLTIDPFYVISNGFGIYQPSAGGARLTVRNGVMGWEGSTSAAFPVTMDAKNNIIFMDNMELCPVGSRFGLTFTGCGTTNPISLLHDVSPSGGDTPVNSQVYLRNTSIINGAGTAYRTQFGEESYYGPTAVVTQDCNACSAPAIKHNAWVPGGFLSYDTAIAHSSGFSLRMTPRINTFSGYIAGTTLTMTSGTPAWLVGGSLTSNGVGFVDGTTMISGAGTVYTVSQSQTVCSSGSPCQFQSYNRATGSLPRMQSAPYSEGLKVGVSSGGVANVCVWARPSINTDAAPPWGGSAATYNGDAPRMIAKANPYMGLQVDTVMGTSSLTAGTWGQFCANTPTAPVDGVFEIVVDASQTFTSNAGGSVNLAEWSCTNCGALNNTQFWWNGAPTDGIAPAAAGGGLLVNPGMRGGMN